MTISRTTRGRAFEAIAGRSRQPVSGEGGEHKGTCIGRPLSRRTCPRDQARIALLKLACARRIATASPSEFVTPAFARAVRLCAAMTMVVISC